MTAMKDLTLAESVAFARAFQAYLRYNHWVPESHLERATFLAQQWLRKYNLDFSDRDFGIDMVHALRIRRLFVLQWDDDEIERMTDAFNWWFDAAMRHYQRTTQWIQPPQAHARPYGTFYGMMPSEDSDAFSLVSSAEAVPLSQSDFGLHV